MCELIERSADVGLSVPVLARQGKNRTVATNHHVFLVFSILK